MILDASSERALLLDRRGRILALNDVAVRFLKTSRKAAVGRSVFELLPPDLAAWRRRQFNRAVRTSRPMLIEDERGGRRLITRILPILNARGEVARAAVFARDVTEQREAVERERRRIAAELHDHVGQTLADVRLRLQRMRALPAARLKGSLGDLERLVEVCARQIWEALRELAPPPRAVPLDKAIARLCRDGRRRHRLRVEFQSEGVLEPLDWAAHSVLVQAVRELLTNVAKHSGTRRARVVLKGVRGGVRIEVTDHGIGIAAGRSRPVRGVGGFGLANIRQQVRHLGGALKVQAARSGGTRVTLQVPRRFGRTLGGSDGYPHRDR